ncbi:MAG: site-specific integrase [Anaerolineales bacterium]|jgi:site-specific recombinase XerD|nr:site-specific integrase [Anaerolineales bacterium]
MSQPSTIESAVQAYLQSVFAARSPNTARTYGNAMNIFRIVLSDHGVDVNTQPPSDLKEEMITWLAAGLKAYAAATERLYLTAAVGFYEYLAAENMASPNLPRLRLLVEKRARRPGIRLPQFPQDAIEKVLVYIQNLDNSYTLEPVERLRFLRDRAFLVTLADTGLRVHEACALKRSDIDWNEGRTILTGKGNRQAVVRFSSRALAALRAYLAARAELDGASGRPLASLPLFTRHDKGAGKKLTAITTATGRNIVTQRVEEALGKEAAHLITPHSFRHYFVTTVLRASGNLKLAQELARHQNIAVTQRYAHLSNDELDRGYHEIFEDKP